MLMSYVIYIINNSSNKKKNGKKKNVYGRLSVRKQYHITSEISYIYGIKIFVIITQEGVEVKGSKTPGKIFLVL